MKKQLIWMLLMLPFAVAAQNIKGTWQLVEEKSCMESAFDETDTEKELSPSMGASRNAVARLIKLGDKGKGEEGIFSQGKKKGSSMNEIRYQVRGNELQFLDKKSGIIKSRYIIDELSESTLRFHNAQRECEIKIFTRVK